MSSPIHNAVLNESQIKKFLADGVLVVDDVLTKEETSKFLSALEGTLARHGVETLSVEDEESALNFSKLSSTNGSGGVLDIFYEPWKMDIATNAKLFEITKELWAAAYCHKGEKREDLHPNETFRWHPFGPFDADKGYLYMDRVGYRLPSKMAQDLGDRINPTRKKKARAIQRSLTPHLDCCPISFYEASSKWRPIQCFVSLTDNLELNTGGFEAALGFHREFDAWAKLRPDTVVVQKHPDRSTTEMNIPAPCIGQYTHIRPKEDAEVMKRVQHVAVRAGSAVFFDNRTPHANSYRHNGDIPRAVVYCSFLPDIELNREYVRKQLEDFEKGHPPRDQWNHMEDDRVDDFLGAMKGYQFTELGRKLMGIDSWLSNS